MAAFGKCDIHFAVFMKLRHPLKEAYSDLILEETAL